jgi:ABC-type multidrug transport system ATPase subunit
MEILLDSVYLSFGTNEVLRGAYLRMKKGQVTGMLGRNGTGKSCLLKILTGQLRPENLYIGVDGVYTKDLYAVPGLINYLPQHTCHPDGLQLSKILSLYGVDSGTFMERHGHLFPEENPRFGILSGGTKRLFEVLLLLAADTHFTLLDEPFSHIMPLHIGYVSEVIRRRSAVKGILVTDHQYEHVLDVADTLHLIQNGASRLIDGREDLVRYGYLR